MNYYKLRSKYKKVFISIALLFGILVFFHSAFLKDVIYESDDYKHHAVRTASYYLALKQGQLPVRWGPNLNQGYGYPSFNYSYHTPYFIGALLHGFGFTIQESVNLTVLFSIVLASLGAYLLAKIFMVSNKWSVLLSLFYVTNPYILLTMYWRGAVGELFFYGLIPFFLFLIKKYTVSKNTIYLLFLSFITALLVVSHIPSLLLLFLVTVVFIYSINKSIFTKKLLLHLGISGITGLLLSAWYVIPAYFEQWMITYYNGSSLSQYATQLLPFTSVLDIRKNFYSSDLFLNVVTIGGLSFLSILIALGQIPKSITSRNWLTLIFISLFLISAYSRPVWEMVVPLQYIQFPWRFLWVITISSFFIFISLIRKKEKHILFNFFCIPLFILGLFFTAQDFIKIKGTTTRTDFEWYHPTTATGSSFDEHQPIWSNIPYYLPNETELAFIYASQSAELTHDTKTSLVHDLNSFSPQILKFDGTTIQYEITPDAEIITLHKRLFYHGWKAYLEGEEVDFLQNIPEYEGLLVVQVPAQKTIVTVTFTGQTKLREISEYISLFTLLFLILYTMTKVYPYVKKSI